MKKVLVTGGAGLIGSHIATHYHAAGHEVLVIDNLERSQLLGHEVQADRKNFNHDRLRKLGIRVKTLDVSKPFTWELIGEDWEFSPDYILHMAAQCGVPTSIRDPLRDFEVNTMGTILMLEFARKHGSKVVYASTNKVYPLHGPWYLDEEAKRYRWAMMDWDDHGFPVDGHHALRKCNPEYLINRTPYGTSKYAGDLLCQEYYHTYGVETGIFRMSCIYGDHQFAFEEQGWASFFVIAALKGLPIKVFGDGFQVRDMLWVDDVVDAYDCFLTSKVPHGVWNLGGGPTWTLSVNRCIDIVQKITGETLNVTYEDWRPSDQRIYTSDIRPLYDQFGWTPSVAPYHGLKRVSDWAKPIIEVF